MNNSEIPGQYSEAEALEEAGKMQDMIEHGHASSYAEAEKKLADTSDQKKFEVTPEIIERVMARVSDINQPKTAISLLRDSGILDRQKNTISDILREGYYIPGNDYKERISNESRKSKWARNIRSGKELFFHCNIVGDDVPSISEAGFWDESEVGIAFSIRRFDDAKKMNYTGARKNRRVIPENLGPSWGAIISSRAAPRDFLGLVLRPLAQLSELEIEELKSHGYIKKYRDETQKELIQKKIEKLLEDMHKADPEKNSRFIPIYDREGGLLWPKKMSHEEVQEFVAEKEKGKTE